MYALARPILFRFDAETVHDRVMDGLVWCGRHPGALRLLAWSFRRDDPRLALDAFGLRFPNPVGLAAGFDKDGRAVATWRALGFGYVELGSVTALPQPGNPKPRLFRLADDDALINRMGFNNAGADALAMRLGDLGGSGARPRFPIGVNVGKSRAAPLDHAVADYEASLRRVWPHADYLVLNVSSPNTPGLRQLQELDRLEPLLELAGGLRRELGARPVLLKLSPDLATEDLDGIVALAERRRVDGLIAANTTVGRLGLRTDPTEAGGLSGRPLREPSLAMLRALRARTELPLVSVGGVASAADVLLRLRAGASLVQLYTGLVYRGPMLMRRICRGLLDAIEREGVRDLRELVAAGEA